MKSSKSKILVKICRIITVIYILSLFMGCAAKEYTYEEKEQILNNPKKSLWITVKSEPSGAKVYSASGNTPGTYLGTTPLTLKYTMIYGGIWGSAASETIEADWKADTPLSSGKAFLAFKCYVVSDGHSPYKIYEVLQDDSWWFVGLKHLELAGKKRTFTAFLSHEQPRSVAASTRFQYQPDSSEKCAIAKQDYGQAVSAYNVAKSDRGSSRAGEALGLLGSVSKTSEAGLWGLFAGANRNKSNDSQADMDHALRLMEDAKSRMSIYCGN